MKTLSAKYKGNRLVELLEDINLPEDMEVLVVVPEQDEEILRSQLRYAAEAAFAKLWDNQEDEVWNEYLNADLETVTLSTSPEFIDLIERSRARLRAEGGISPEEMRRQLGLEKPE